MSIGTFPFGQPVLPVNQTDTTPKKVFVLGVYASAVHACWIGPDGNTKIRAVGIKSEPYIFWRGDRTQELIDEITVLKEAGKLVPAAISYNGPSAIALDKQILKPLGLDRSNAWLCDLVPHSCMNDDQKKALEREYKPLEKAGILPPFDWPEKPEKWADEKRVKEIFTELKTSTAGTLILLGDQPIEWFLNKFDKRYKRLAEFGIENSEYGKLHPVKIDGVDMQVLPVAHPRQIAKLGMHSPEWFKRHSYWETNVAPHLL
ncbi:MAG TPA: hypothetical protein PLP19_10610 [bacterium]|nr:hypothetical protein [bacterium]HPN43930.1 hypothetical protein [bacterium]